MNKTKKTKPKTIGDMRKLAKKRAKVAIAKVAKNRKARAADVVSAKKKSAKRAVLKKKR